MSLRDRQAYVERRTRLPKAVSMRWIEDKRSAEQVRLAVSLAAATAITIFAMLSAV
ncbi:MAG: hypothetical protein AB7U75_13450 [Hyphomicrobiaceae bacterium]